MLICRNAEEVHGHRKVWNPCSRTWVLHLGGKVRKGGCEYGSDMLLKVLHALISSFVILLSFHYKRHNQNKVISTVNRNGDFLTFACSKLDS